ncbi:AAA family ATPase [Candidatus Woesearchaeota archaeon]|nr:AAA family ATPase [Candidatus Woesearchaeota archaeon]
MGLFDDMLGSEESLFKDPEALDFSFQPKPMKYREKQQEYMAGCIKPLFQGRNGKNLFIYGVPGIGKTLACKQLIEELEEKAEDITPLYVNCWHKNSSFKVYLELCELLGYRLTQNKNRESLFKSIKDILNKVYAVFVFDEIDKVEDLDFLYSILEGLYKKSVFMITNYRDWIDNVEERIRSRMMADNLEFKPYSIKETEGILKQRISHAFVQDVLEEGAFQAILKKTAELEDIRAGLSMLRDAASNAENRASRKITKEDAESAIDKLDEYNLENPENLDGEPKLIFNIIKKNKSIRMGDLFKEYQKKGGNMSYRSLFRKVNKLADDRLITLEKKEGGPEGTTTIVKCRKIRG